MAENSVSFTVDGRSVRTLRDLLPKSRRLRILFVGKCPAPKSVDAGHYLQGRQGRMFWNRLMDYGLLRPETQYEDDSLIAHGYGITDIVKIPRTYGNEPSDREYAAGLPRILDLIQEFRPRVVVFIYKGVLDAVMRIKYDVSKKAIYGFNPELNKYFEAQVFVFPMPGTPCTSDQASAAMKELVVACREPHKL